MAQLSLQNISKKFIMGNQELLVLNNISFTVEPGEFLAICGKSGSGKTTLMNILGCLDTPTAGTYVIEKTNVSNMNPDQLAHLRNKKIGFVFQKFNLIPDLSALDNVALPQLYAGNSEPDARAKAHELLKILELDDRAHHLPYQLSGGQQQRVAIARALINNPSIILADEPTGNLDSKTGTSIMNMFFDLNAHKGITVILITHDQALASKAPRTINIADGVIVK